MSTTWRESIGELIQRIRLMGERGKIPAKVAADIRHEIVDTAARATLLTDKRARLKHEVLAKHTDIKFLPSKRKLNEIATFTAVRSRIQKGKLGIPPPWNGDFVLGLKVSGAAREAKRPFDYLIYISSVKRAEFNKALEDASFAFIRYDHRYIGAPLFSWYPPETKDGPSVMAGIFAGSTYRDGRVEIRSSDLVKELLDLWTIRYEEKGCLLVVSAYYAMLFASYMPKAFSAPLLKMAYAEDCPLLPAMYWERLFQRKGERLLPHPNILPYGVSKGTLESRKWTREWLSKTSREVGVYNVYSGLRDEMGRWVGTFKDNPSLPATGIVARLYEENLTKPC